MNDMEEIIKNINDTNASYRTPGAGDAKNTDLFLDSEHFELFKGYGEHIKVRYNKENLQKAILFIASILPRKYDNSAVHKMIPFSLDFVREQMLYLEAFFKINGKKVDERIQTWNARKDVLKKNGEIDNRFYFNGLLEEFHYSDNEGNIKIGKFTIRNYLAGGYSKLKIRKGEDGIFDLRVINTIEQHNEKEENLFVYSDNDKTVPLQVIYYGAPGTGKSYSINHVATESNSIRTTFHPDSDYSTFVGCYKPVKQSNNRSHVKLSLSYLKSKAESITQVQAGDKVEHIIDFVSKYAERLNEIVEEHDEILSLQHLLNKFLGFSNETYLAKVVKKTIEERRNNGKITYEFVPQAFTTAYINAWSNLDDPYYLIIEEINRGNCAQIFGDIFQLLDRNETGYSSYKITPDMDLQQYLCKKFENVSIDDEDIKNGVKMQLPANLHILATMNTSDQSLFPIDSAFKRRWDWKYIPIDYTDKGHYISCGEKHYKWTDFLEKVNFRIESVTQSEDKKMGGWFVKPIDKEITADKFVSKVVFYLWNDIFKDFAHNGNTIFKDEFKNFNSFFDFNGDVKIDVLDAFLISLELIPIEDDFLEFNL